MRTLHEVSIYVDVHDPKELKKAAEKQAVKEGLDVKDWRKMRKDNPISNDLRMMFDQPVPGCSNQDSSVE